MRHLPKGKKTLKWWIVFGAFSMGTLTGILMWLWFLVIPEGHGEIDWFIGMPLYSAYILGAACFILFGWAVGCIWGVGMYFEWQEKKSLWRLIISKYWAGGQVEDEE